MEVSERFYDGFQNCDLT